MTKIAMIIEQFDASIMKIEKSNETQLIKLNLKIKRTQDSLNELRLEVKLNSFVSSRKEIIFFKKQKPYIKGRLKFYVSVNTSFFEKPIGSKSEIRKYINLQLSMIRNENCKYNHFVNYYKLEDTNKDKIYFLRGVNQFDLFIDNTTIYEDPEFCTLRDYLASEIVANDLLNQFYIKELELLKTKNAKPKIQEIQNTQNYKILWTGTITELVELLIASNTDGAIGNGNLSLKQIKEICINNFGINPGNIYQIVEQITARKSNPTKFVDKLKISLINEINDLLRKS